MPLQRCEREGKKGWRWGNNGKCYVGKGAKQKALKQGQAIAANNAVDEGIDPNEAISRAMEKE